MENASKALIMACGVLIGILLISLAVYLFVDFGSTVAKINDKNTEQQLVEFNSRFTSFEQYKKVNDAGYEEWEITIYNIITLAGYAKENNRYYEDDPTNTEDIISINISNENPKNIVNSNYEQLIKKYRNVDGTLKKFRYEGVSYNNTGKVNSVTFKVL